MTIPTGHAWVVSRWCDGVSSPAYWAGSSWVEGCSSSSSSPTSCGERASPSPTARTSSASVSTPSSTRRRADHHVDDHDDRRRQRRSGDQPTVGPTIAAPNDGNPVGLPHHRQDRPQQGHRAGHVHRRSAPGARALPRHAPARRAGQCGDRRAPHDLRRTVLRPRPARSGRPHRGQDGPGHVHVPRDHDLDREPRRHGGGRQHGDGRADPHHVQSSFQRVDSASSSTPHCRAAPRPPPPRPRRRRTRSPPRRPTTSPAVRGTGRRRWSRGC